MRALAYSWLLFFGIQIAGALETMPSNILQMDSRFNHHVILVEKSTHKLYLYENNNGDPKLIKVYNIATGKIQGDKSVEGDHKTPEGIYTLKSFYSDLQLNKMYGEVGKIYGIGAFTTDYPNLVDVRQGKTGSNIWLHSTDDDSRVSKKLDSRGCVVAVRNDLIEISKYIDLNNTSIIIVQNLNHYSQETWKENKKALTNAVDTWATSWKNKEFDTYINTYSPNFRNEKGNYAQYKAYKKAVFSRADQPAIEFRNISILANDSYAVVTLEQDYHSDIIKDVGKKVLYLTRDQNYQWKIIAERFQKLTEEGRNLAFTPAMRFFEQSDDKTQVSN